MGRGVKLPSTERPKRRWSLLLLNFLLFAVPGTYFFYPQILEFTGSLIISGDAPANADAIVVLAGGDPGRPRAAAELFRQGLAPLVVITTEIPPGGIRVFQELKAEGIELHESFENYSRVLLGNGVPESRIIRIEPYVSSTIEELDQVRTLARKRRWQSLVIVTSKYHSRRTGIVADYYLRPEFETRIVGSRFDPYSPSAWWRSRSQIRVFITEFQKLVAYSFYYYPKIWLGMRAEG